MEKYIVAQVLGTASTEDEKEYVKGLFPHGILLESVTYYAERDTEGPLAQVAEYKDGVITLVIGPVVEPLIG